MPFIDQYNGKEIEFPSHSKDWNKFEQNNNAIALNILHVPYNTEQIRLAYISKYNHERNNQVILLMITDNDENWHYFASKGISRLLKGITSKHKGDFYCLNCFHSRRIKETLKKHEKVYKDHDQNLLQKKKLSILLQVTHGIHVVHLIHQKTNGVITEKKTVWKCFVKI